MWEQYQKNFFGMQFVILFITWAVFSRSHLWSLAAIFFLTMEVCAVAGAAWGNRIKKKLRRSNGALQGS